MTGSLLDEYDTRKILNPNGCPCLHVAEMKVHGKTLTATAFRSGSGTISNAISSTHQGHWWNAQSVSCWNRLPDRDEYFLRMAITNDTEERKERELLDDIIDYKISVITIEQGRACWHLMRKWSLTSYPSIEMFRSMFSYFWKSSIKKEDWIEVAKKIYGPNWQQQSNTLVPPEQREDAILLFPSN